MRARVARLFPGVTLAVGLVLSPLAARAAGVPVDKANAEQKATATEHFEEGMTLFDDEKYDEALAAFRASYEAVASPNSHLLVARSLSRLGRSDDAYNEYTNVMDEAAALGEAYNAAGVAARNEREMVRRRVALLTIELPEAPPGVEVTVNEKLVQVGDKPIAVLPGDVVVEARAPDGATSSRKAKAEAGAVVHVTLPKPVLAKELEKDEKPPPAAAADTRTPGQKARRDASYYAFGIGVGGIATWAVITIAGAEALDDVAVGGLLVGGIGVGAGVVLFLTSEPATSSGRPAGTPRASVTIGPSSVALQGTF